MVNQPSNLASPDYLGLVNFILQPLLDENDSLSLDCEVLNNQQNVWIRLAIQAEDKGKIFGRSMRNMEAIKILLQTAASSVGQSVYLDLYGDHLSSTSQKKESPSRPSHQKKPSSRRAPLHQVKLSKSKIQNNK